MENNSTKNDLPKEERYQKYGSVATLKTSPLLLLGVVLLVVLGGLIIYQGIASISVRRASKFSNFSISPGFMRIEEGEHAWTIQYEKKTSSQFKGLVRHTSPIHLDEIPLLTHDILVTSGDYADPELVTVSVANHQFRWLALTEGHPEGKINLLHTVPKDESIYQQLISIKTGDTVIITGWEILRIDALDSNQKPIMWWQDDGCNTLLVDGVELIK